MRFEPQVDGKRRVREALKVDEAFEEEPRIPVLLYVPIILIVISAMDHFMLMFNAPFVADFLRGDQTFAFLGGLLFGGLLSVGIFGLYRQRRWAVWLIAATLVVDTVYAFAAYAGFDAQQMAVMRTPVMNWMGTTNVTMMGVETGISSGAAYIVRTVVLLIVMVPYLWLTEK